MFTLQERRPNGTWATIKGYKSEATALDRCRAFGEASPRQTFRVITPGRVVGMRCPAVQNDMHIR